MATMATAPRGSGLYLRGCVWRVRIRTPIGIGAKISIRRFWRFSTGANSRVEALRAAAHLRAALDRGSTLVKLGIGTAMVDAGQVEAKRMIPIHDELLRLGIVEWAERRRREGAVRLLEVKRGSLGTYSSWFSKLYHNYRVAEGIYERGQDHHSLRKDFYQDLRSGGVDYAIRVRMMGHELNDVSEGSYGPKVENMAHLKSAIDRIPVDTLHLRPRSVDHGRRLNDLRRVTPDGSGLPMPRRSPSDAG